MRVMVFFDLPVITSAILILVTIEIILSVTAAVLISRKIGKKVYKPLHMIEKTGEDSG